MAIAPPITDIEKLKSHPALGRLVEWNSSIVQAVKYDRDELTIWVEKEAITGCSSSPNASRSSPPTFCSPCTTALPLRR